MASAEQKVYIFNWKIDNFFSCYQKNGVQLPSPIFTAENFGGSKWSIFMFPKGNNKESEDYISCYLIKKADDVYGEVSKIDFELKMIDGNGKEIKSLVNSYCSFKKGDGKGWDQFIKIQEVIQERTKWKEESLTVRCIMKTSQMKKNLIECNALTKIGVHRQSFTWVVKVLDSASQFNKKQFTFHDQSQFEITLSLPSDVYKIQIRREVDKSPTPRHVVGNISICNLNGRPSFGKWDSYIFEPSVENDVWEFPSFLTKRQLKDGKKNFVKDGEFQLSCTFSASNGVETEAILSDTRLGVDTLSSLQEDLRSLLANKKFSDLKLQVEGEMILAHKCFLSSRSPVFSAMFEQNMTENQTGIVRIEDEEKKYIKLFLEFLYTGSVERMDYNNASKLLMIAEKYQVLSLKEKCSSFLVCSLNVNNVCEVLVNADRIKHELLKTSALNYIATHAKDVLKTPEWAKWIESNVALSTEVFSNIANNFEISPKKFSEPSLSATDTDEDDLRLPQGLFRFSRT